MEDFRAMRRVAIAVAVLACFLGSVPAANASPGFAAHRVDSTFHGAGAFQQTCKTVTRIGNGVVRGGWLAHSTYSFSECVTFASSPPYVASVGWFQLVDPSNATLKGTISGTVDPEAREVIVVRLIGGTGHFAAARGRLRLGPITTSHATHCDPEGSICSKWRDRGALRGTVENAGS